MPQRLVFGQDDLFGFVLIIGFEADAFAGVGIDAIKLVKAFIAADETESSFHGTAQLPVCLRPIPNGYGVAGESGRIR